jgi:hypothetical protein
MAKSDLRCSKKSYLSRLPLQRFAINAGDDPLIAEQVDLTSTRFWLTRD